MSEFRKERRYMIKKEKIKVFLRENLNFDTRAVMRKTLQNTYNFLFYFMVCYQILFVVFFCLFCFFMYRKFWRYYIFGIKIYRGKKKKTDSLFKKFLNKQLLEFGLLFFISPVLVFAFKRNLKQREREYG